MKIVLEMLSNWGVLATVVLIGLFCCVSGNIILVKEILYDSDSALIGMLTRIFGIFLLALGFISIIILMIAINYICSA